MTSLQANVRALLAARTWRCADESALQREIEIALAGAGIAFTREVQLGPRDRIDFMAGDLGIEVKIKGGRNAVMRQLARYAAHDCIAELLLVTTRLQHARMPRQLSGKPLHVLPLLGASL